MIYIKTKMPGREPPNYWGWLLARQIKTIVQYLQTGARKSILIRFVVAYRYVISLMQYKEGYHL